METMLRQWTLPRAIPRPPRKADARSLGEPLEREDFEVSTRTLGRDLVKLSTIFPLANDEAPTLQGWSWMRDADALRDSNQRSPR